MGPNQDRLFLGFDSSTQGIKAALIDARLNVIHESAVNYDSELPAYKTKGGVHSHADGLTFTSPTLMWAEALDLLLTKMKRADGALSKVVAISGSGQQHGSVWFKKGAQSSLQRLDGAKDLKTQLADAFSVSESPIWMDASTTAQCRALEAALGGPQAVADLTGSRAFERFTGNQIAKISQQQAEAYANTERIALVSSFMASLFVGDYAPIDTADGSGMNLMDIRSKTWAPQAVKNTAPDLAGKLGAIAAAHTPIGKISRYFVQRYGFSAGTQIFAFSGDNPCSLAGLRLQETGDIAISLGTSDTLFGSLAQPSPSATEGHIFANPVDPHAYMAMVVRMNGSLTREYIRDQAAGGSWEGFNQALAQTRPGNAGHIGFYVKDPEITPPILKTGMYRFGPNGAKADAFPGPIDVRALVESQFLSMRIHGANIGIRPKSILATGGASANQGLIQIIANVFGAPVFTGEQPNSASIGAAYRALHGWTCAQKGSFVSFAEVMADAPPFKKSATPDSQAHQGYNEMIPTYARLEDAVVKSA